MSARVIDYKTNLADGRSITGRFRDIASSVLDDLGPIDPIIGYAQILDKFFSTSSSDFESWRKLRSGRHFIHEGLCDPTEGAIESLWADATSGKNIYRAREIIHEQQNEAALLSSHRVERLTRVQAVFGVSTQTLAKILNISRPQLYKWLDSNLHITLQDASNSRLTLIESLADYWSELSTQPLSPWVKADTGPKALMNLLCADSLSEDDVRLEMRRHLETILNAKKTRSEQLRDAGFRRRPSVRSLPTDE